jgi:hypothetical protein
LYSAFDSVGFVLILCDFIGILLPFVLFCRENSGKT